MKQKASKTLTYDEQQARCVEFVKNFEDYDSGIVDPIFGKRKYLIQLVFFEFYFSNKLPMQKGKLLKYSSRTWNCSSGNRRKAAWWKDSS